jgi:hypothetical protein
VKMLEANQDPSDYDLIGLTEYLERLETATAITAKYSAVMNDENSKRSRERTNENGNDNDERSKTKYKPNKKPKRTQCLTCNKYHKGDCYFKKEQEKKRHFNDKADNKFTVKEYAHLIQTMMDYTDSLGPNTKRNKRKVKNSKAKHSEKEEE